MLLKWIFLIVVFIIMPLIQIVIVIINYLRFRNIRMLGKKVVPYKNLSKPKYIKILFFLSLYIFAASVFSIIMEKNFFPVFWNLVLLPMLLMFILISKISEKNGFYENGLVCGLIVPWNKISSWKAAGENELCLNKKSGACFTLKEIEDMDAVINVLRTNGIQEEK